MYGGAEDDDMPDVGLEAPQTDQGQELTQEDVW
jgi:hypothetical protein